MRDEPGLGRGGEGTVRPRPCRGVSDEAENEQYVRGPTGGSQTRRRMSSTSEALPGGLGRGWRANCRCFGPRGSLTNQ